MDSPAEYDYSCPVCRDVFSAPVILECSHSVCKECLQQFWRIKKIRECPVCRRLTKHEPTCNLALKNLCESFLERNENLSSGSEELCSLHSEKLKLFCLEDKQPACLVCFTSQTHVNHTFRPIDEVASSYKVGALARGLIMTSCVVIPAGGVLIGLAAGESVVPLNCLVFFLPWWLYDANCRMDFKDCARRSTANVESNYESLS